MSLEKRVYLGGDPKWEDKGHHKWNEVIQPFSHNGEINEALTYFTFQ
jgi:hypothetical protein